MGSVTNMFFYHSLRACVPFILVLNNICFSCVELCYVVKFYCETMVFRICLVIYIGIILYCALVLSTHLFYAQGMVFNSSSQHSCYCLILFHVAILLEIILLISMYLHSKGKLNYAHL